MSDARRLAAILAIDLVGYSKLMGEDESGTAKAVRERREVMRPLVRDFGGRLVKTMGDGELLEFPSIVAAVGCAIAIQKRMADCNSGEHKPMLYRMGVNLGDVIVDGDDILGDGVNVAARLEGICDPGGVTISDFAYESVRGRIEAPFTDLGERSLKNIERPVRVFALAPQAIAAAPEPTRPLTKAKAPFRTAGNRRAAILAAVVALAAFSAVGIVWRTGRLSLLAGPPAIEDKLASTPRLSIVVLPFDNLSGDKEQDYFAEGITDDLTTDLSHLPDSFVIARNTAFTYRGKAVDVKELGRDLGVRYALEGSVRRVGDSIAINAQLISTETGAHVWADRFEGDRNRLGRLQVEVVTRLSRPLGAEMVKAESLRARRERPTNPDAIDLAMQCSAQYALPHTRETIAKSIDLCERALVLDPSQPRALVDLSFALSARAINLWSENRSADLQRAGEIADNLLSTNPDYALARLAKAEVLGGTLQWEAAISETQAAIEADSNLASAYADNGYEHIFVGRAEQGTAGIETALRLSPRDPLRFAWEYWLCHIDSHLARWREAIDWCRKSVADNGANMFPWIDLVAAYGLLGETDEAKAALAQLLKLNPKFTVNGLIKIAAFFSSNAVFKEQIERIAAGLREAGTPEDGKAN